MSGLRGVLRLFRRGIHVKERKRIHGRYCTETSLFFNSYHFLRRLVIPDGPVQHWKANLFNTQHILGVSRASDQRSFHTTVPSSQMPQEAAEESAPPSASEGSGDSPPPPNDEAAAASSKPAPEAAETPATSSRNAITPVVPGMPVVRRGVQVAPVGVVLTSQGLIKEMTDRIKKSLFQEAIQIYREWLQCIDPTTGRPNKPLVTPCNIALLAEGLRGAPIDILLKRVDEMRRLGLNPNTDTFYVLFNAAADSKDLGAFDRLFSMVQELGIPVQAEWCIKVIGILADVDAWKAMDYVRIMVTNNLSPDGIIISKLVSAFSRIGQALKATDIVRWGQKKDAYPSLMALGDLLQSCVETDISEGALLALELMFGRRKGRPMMNLALDEGTLLAVLSIAARTGDLALSTKAWEVLYLSLREGRPPSQSSFLARLHASVTGGDLDLAIATLQAMEAAYGSEANLETFSPFTLLRPFVLGCSRGGADTLDTVYFKLEGIQSTQQQVPLSAINCVIMGCSNVWDIDRAYQTFEAIRSVFGHMPNVHSCNVLIDGFGKMRRISESLKVYEYMLDSGLQPDQQTYNLLIKAHSVNRDTRSAMEVVNHMGDAGLRLHKDTASKLRRRFIRECDDEGARRILQLGKKFNYAAGFTGDTRRTLLFPFS